MKVAAIIEALRQHLRGTHDRDHNYALYSPRAAPSAGLSAAPSITG